MGRESLGQQGTDAFGGFVLFRKTRFTKWLCKARGGLWPLFKAERLGKLRKQFGSWAEAMNQSSSREACGLQAVGPISHASWHTPPFPIALHPSSDRARIVHCVSGVEIYDQQHVSLKRL